MSGLIAISTAQVGQLLGFLRPLDVSLALKVYSGSALDPLPSYSDLCQPQAGLFWLTALTSYAQHESHSGLLLDPDCRLQDLFADTATVATGAALSEEMGSLRLVELVGTVEQLGARYGLRCATESELAERPEAVLVYRPAAKLIYLNRWYQMEAELGAFLRQRFSRAPLQLPDEFAQRFQRFFTPVEVVENPWQAAACLAALRSEFAVITGGPGTGKTTTITRLLCLLMELDEAARPSRVKLVAQTGKAAERMREAFNANLDAVLATLPPSEAASLAERCHQRIDPASTIHQLLGYRGMSHFLHHAGNPISCDVLIVDEATMVDLELFLKLFRALPANCRIILLGDKNQLSAVETGNVFSDLTTASGTDPQGLNVFSEDFAQCFSALSTVALPAPQLDLPLLGDRVVELVRSYRFTADSEVGRLARLLLDAGRLPHADECALTTLEQNWPALLRSSQQAYRSALSAQATPEQLLHEVEQTRVLCAVRGGPQGSESINALLTDAIFGSSGQSAGVPLHGLPLIIVRNDKQLGLWNGDCGVFYCDSESGQLGAYFPAKAEGEPPRRFNPFALPEWEPAFALTIHKSQGSEYASVVVVLPATQRNFITWELVYTGITRAKRSVQLILPTNQLGQPLPRVQRVSGLRYEMG